MISKFMHLIDLNDYPREQWNQIISLARAIKKNPQAYGNECSGKILATLFYEPSTRTQMSFQTAMIRLGGSIIGFDNPSTCSVAKGENLKDTTKVISGYSDILIIRHHLEGSAKAAALTSGCPIINAGDGGHLHPTQTLTDLVTLAEERGSLNNLTVGLCGDLKNGRTVHSLCKALSYYNNNKFILISTPELSLPNYIKDIFTANSCKFTEVSSLEEAMPLLDVLYMTRIQKERFKSEAEFLEQSSRYILDCKKMKLARPELAVLHPLPRVDEILVEVDGDGRALYFKQAQYGVYTRMALIMYIMKNGVSSGAPVLTGGVSQDKKCGNPKCITNTEFYLPRSFYENGECEYCNAV